MKSPIIVEIRKKADCQDVPLPQYMSEHASGMDICAACDDKVEISPGDIKLIPCGFYIAVPIGFEAQVRPRSGLALKHGITLPNTPGTIDADYRGEVCVILGNIGKDVFVVERGMRIAQMVIAAVSQAEMKLVEKLSDTARGAGGFGHTGT